MDMGWAWCDFSCWSQTRIPSGPKTWAFFQVPSPTLCKNSAVVLHIHASIDICSQDRPKICQLAPPGLHSCHREWHRPVVICIAVFFLAPSLKSSPDWLILSGIAFKTTSLKWHLACPNFISLVTSCIGLREEGPQTTLRHALYMGISNSH